MFLYQAYGLNIQSDFSLPELTKETHQPNLYIQKDRVKRLPLESTSINRQGKEAYFAGGKQNACLRWDGVATLLAQKGNTLIVNPDNDDITSQQLSLYILSEALGLILYQRGLFLLHASAVQIGQRVVLFVGPSGAGKSTTAAAFAQLGYTVLSDDMVAIDLNSTHQPLVYPAFPQIKIWPASVHGLNYDPSTLTPLFPGSHKQVIRQRENFPTEPLPLAHIFFLDNGPELKISRLQGSNAFFSLVRFFPLPSALLQGQALQEHFQQCIQLTDQVDIWKLEKPRDFQVLRTLLKRVEQRVDQTANPLSSQRPYLVQTS